MKLACSTNLFLKYSIEESIQIIKDIGYEGVEILCDIPHAYPPSLDDEKINSIRKTAYDANIPISNLNAFSIHAIGDVNHPSWIEADAAMRDLRINHTLECIRLAKKLGARTLSTQPGGPVSNSSATPEQREHFLDGLMKVMDVKILLEPSPGLLIENSQQFLEFMREVSSDCIGLNFDVGHFYCVKEDPSELVHKLSHYIDHFHIEDISRNRVHKHLIPGLGSINFHSLFSSIIKIGYDGYVTVELHPFQDNPQRAAKRAYNYLNKLRENLLA